MPIILALDTTTEACSAALLVGDTVRERFERLPRGHAERILPMLQELLAEAELDLGRVDALAFCRGPGAFTGVRIACGVAQGVALGADLPVVPLSTLQVLAQGALAGGAPAALAAIDARMGEVYWGAYRAEDGLTRPLGAEVLAAPTAVPPPPGQGWWGVGSGWGAYRDSLGQRLAGQVVEVLADALPRARDCLPLARAELAAGRTVAAEAALPVYLRDKVTG